MTTMNVMFDERDVLEDAAERWWMFLVSGIAWLVFALLVFQWDYTTVYAVSVLFGVVALVAGCNEFVQIAVSTTGWKIVHGILGILFVIAGIWALVHPHNAFATLAALIAFFLMFNGQRTHGNLPGHERRLGSSLRLPDAMTPAGSRTHLARTKHRGKRASGSARRALRRGGATPIHPSLRGEESGLLPCKNRPAPRLRRIRTGSGFDAAAGWGRGSRRASAASAARCPAVRAARRESG